LVRGEKEKRSIALERLGFVLALSWEFLDQHFDRLAAVRRLVGEAQPFADARRYFASTSPRVLMVFAVA
jgi:hypothetical protein